MPTSPTTFTCYDTFYCQINIGIININYGCTTDYSYPYIRVYDTSTSLWSSIDFIISIDSSKNSTLGYVPSVLGYSNTLQLIVSPAIAKYLIIDHSYYFKVDVLPACDYIRLVPASTLNQDYD